LKPTLTTKNKLDRIDYALSQINQATIGGDIVEEFEFEIEGDDIEGLLLDLDMAMECDPECVNNIL
jgi:hypothetical protein